jgi:hypothetical protein
VFDVYSSSLEMSLLVSELLIDDRDTLLWSTDIFEFSFTRQAANTFVLGSLTT